MKIKTIVRHSPADFDSEVNEYLEKGYILGQRGTMPPDVRGTAHYAQMVLLDPPAEPETPDPIEALHDVVDYCHSVPAGECSTDKCRLFYWCQQLRAGGDPTDWDLPEVDA